MGRARWCDDGGQALPWMMLLVMIGLGLVAFIIVISLQSYILPVIFGYR